MFAKHKRQSLIWGSWVVLGLVGCQSHQSELYEELVQEDLSLGEFLEEQDGSLEEWEVAEEKVQQDLAEGKYELSSQGLMEGTPAGSGFEDPMDGVLAGWGEAPAELTADEEDVVVTNEATQMVWVEGDTVGKSEAAESPTWARAAISRDEARDSRESATPEVQPPEGEGEQEGGQPIGPQAFLEEPVIQGGAGVAGPSVAAEEVVSEDEALALLGWDASQSDESLIESDSSKGGGEIASDPVDSGPDDVLVSDGVFVTIHEPASLPRQTSGVDDAQDAFLATLVGRERDVEAWDAPAEAVGPGLDIESMEMIAFTLPDKMDVDLDLWSDRDFLKDQALAFAKTAIVEGFGGYAPQQGASEPAMLASAAKDTATVMLAELTPSATPILETFSDIAPQSAAPKHAHESVRSFDRMKPSVGRVEPVRKPALIQVAAVPSTKSKLVSVKKETVKSRSSRSLAARVTTPATVPGKKLVSVKKAVAPAVVARVESRPTVRNEAIVSKSTQLPRWQSAQILASRVIPAPIEHGSADGASPEELPYYWHDRRMKVILSERIRVVVS